MADMLFGKPIPTEGQGTETPPTETTPEAKPPVEERQAAAEETPPDPPPEAKPPEKVELSPEQKHALAEKRRRQKAETARKKEQQRAEELAATVADLQATIENMKQVQAPSEAPPLPEFSDPEAVAKYEEDLRAHIAAKEAKAREESKLQDARDRQRDQLADIAEQYDGSDGQPSWDELVSLYEDVTANSTDPTYTGIRDKIRGAANMPRVAYREWLKLYRAEEAEAARGESNAERDADASRLGGSAPTNLGTGRNKPTPEEAGIGQKIFGGKVPAEGFMKKRLARQGVQG